MTPSRRASGAPPRRRVVDAALDLFLERWFDDVTLRDVATAAGVALQTVVNHFGSKEGLFVAALERFAETVEQVRYSAVPDDVPGAARVLVKDYERAGDANVRALLVEDRIPAVAQGLAHGWRVHRDWVGRTFPGALSGLTGAARERRLLALCAATDVTTWKYLRRDKGLSRARTAVVLQEMIRSPLPTRKVLSRCPASSSRHGTAAAPWCRPS
ncbi:MAG TPA: TetR/AcrR family transcriptional regulator, partial [Thermoleophilaceae bacterium]|nr:TetR/AcrR family transcriptional regulator [Thermoleophilaceae bacterium]